MAVYDQKHLSKEKRDSLEVAEDAREEHWMLPSFVAELFGGRLRWSAVHPFPVQPESDKVVGDAFMKKLEAFLKEKLNPDEVDRTGLIPDEVYEGLGKMGCFALKIPKIYGGQGMSQINYNRIVGLVASYCGSTAVMLSAHQSIGVPQPLILFGTEEQKKKFLPRFASQKYISAFALTEVDVGSDPANMKTTAEPTADGSHYILNGQKLWCTNGPIADIYVVMARTPSKMVNGREKKQITAFIVERSMPGVEVIHRCSFMGLNGIQNGLIQFTNVKVPKENILIGTGAGLRLALTTLNTGRLTVPAATSTMAKLCVNIARDWCGKRFQWGNVIGKHEAIGSKVARMISMTYAMESVTWLVSAMADSKKVDMRLEAAMSKLFCTEAAWRIADDTVQIRGGRGYERSASLRDRGEEAIPAERILRDCRINLIIEGTSEIMHLFIAREALDPHLKRAADLFNPKASFVKKLACVVKAGFHYALWYPSLFIPRPVNKSGVPSKLKRHLSFVEKSSRKLARSMFAAMMIHQAKLERKQLVLARLVNIGTDLFAMASSIARSAAQSRSGGEAENSVELCDLFCIQAEDRIRTEFKHLFRNEDEQAYRVARNVLEKRYSWIEKGIFGNI